MKKVILGIAALAVVACEKGEDLQQPVNKKSAAATTERYEDYQPSEDLVTEIQNFVNSAEADAISNMPLNEAVWKLEAAVSFVNRYRMFDYEAYGYRNLEYTIEMNGEEAIGSSIDAIYDHLLTDIVGQGEHFLYADLHAEIVEGTATIHAMVKFAHHKFPWSSRRTSVGERQAGIAGDCPDPVTELYNSRYLTGHNLVAERALNKYQNSIGYSTSLYYFWSTIVREYPDADRLAGNDNAMYGAHAKGTLIKSDCVNKSQMEGYRDHVFGQLSNRGGTVLDCFIHWNDCYDGCNNSTGSWTYTVPWGAPITARGGIRVAYQGYMEDPFVQ